MVKAAPASVSVLKSRMYQLGMVKELLVHPDVACLRESRFGAALTNVKELTERMIASEPARIGAILKFSPLKLKQVEETRPKGCSR